MQLFQAICSEECESQAESLFNFDPDDRDVEATLTRIGIDFVSLVCRPEKASSARTVIAIAERMPEIGRAFGGKHHTTVIHSVEKIQSLTSADTSFQRLLLDMSEGLQK